MPNDLQILLDRLGASQKKTKNKMLFFRASQETLDVLDHIVEQYGGNITRSEIVRISMIHGLTDMMKQD